jgi:hypothetical protein
MNADIFYTLKTGSRFDKKRFREDIQLFEKNDNLDHKEDGENCVQNVATDLDFFGCRKHEKNELKTPETDHITTASTSHKNTENRATEDLFGCVEKVGIWIRLLTAMILMSCDRSMLVFSCLYLKKRIESKLTERIFPIPYPLLINYQKGK